ncbi:RDD family protein [Streptomyces minutiscleroticus]|nr:RDD family protein [Streptomyces minutiscleroticus]
MSTEPPPSDPGQPPDDDPFRKRQPPPGGGSPYDTPPPPGGSPYGNPPPPGGGSPYGSPLPPYGGDPFGGGPLGGDPLAGMPPLADPARRVFARLVDMVLVGVVVYLVCLLFGVHQYKVDDNGVRLDDGFWQSLIAAVLYVAYDTFMVSLDGQTLGKRLFRLRVANLRDGSTPLVPTALVRALALWLPFAFCCACVWTAVAGGWSLIDRPYRQGLHDKAARTVVVSTA